MTTPTHAHRRRPAARPGFSLLELTAVLVILGLLTTIAAVAVPAQIRKARISTTKTSMSTIKSQIESYRAENAGEAPPTIDALIGPYMEDGAQYDAWDEEFYYLPTPGGERNFELRSGGPDKQMGTEDDIDLWTMNRDTSDGG